MGTLSEALVTPICMPFYGLQASLTYFALPLKNRLTTVQQVLRGAKGSLSDRMRPRTILWQ